MGLSLREQAAFETSKRLLAQVINEGLLKASLSRFNGADSQQLTIRRTQHASDTTGIQLVKVSVYFDVNPETTPAGEVLSTLRPEALQPPIILIGGERGTSIQYDPGALFHLFSHWFQNRVDDDLRGEIVAELRNSVANQVWWLENAQYQLLDINSPSIEWEKTLVWGHPTHPWHRTCYSIPPLACITPESLAGIVNPTLTFLSVPWTSLRISGPFEDTLQKLLDELEVPRPHTDAMVIPCLEKQLPSILMRFPDAVVLKSSQCAQAQASMRTVTLSPRLNFSYHMKLSLACRITSAMRTITPWTACGGASVSQLLEQLLPSDLWVFREVAAICGSQTNFDEAKHLACILRDDLESRADMCGERLIIAAALAQKSVQDGRSWAERLFGLDSIAAKQVWFKSYTQCLFELTLPPLANHGICLESHGQNMVGRFCRRTGALKGFAIRDYGGLRLHMPTLQEQGYSLDAIAPGSAVKTEDLQACWSKAHHTLIQMHLGHLIAALRLEAHGGWATVRDQLLSVLASEKVDNGESLCAFFMRDTMRFKCFIKMKLEGKYRDYVERDVPNVLLR